MNPTPSKSLSVFWYENTDTKDPALSALALAFDTIVLPKSIKYSEVFADHDTFGRPIASRDQHFSPSFGQNNDVRVVAGCQIPPNVYSSLEDHKIKLRNVPTAWYGDAQAESGMIDSDAAEFSAFGLSTFIQAAKLQESPLIGRSAVESMALLSPERANWNAGDLLSLWTCILSTAGIAVALPQVPSLSQEDLIDIRRRVAEEREEYQIYIRELLFDGASFLHQAQSISEIEDWAKFIAKTKIATALSRMRRAIEKQSSRPLLEKISISLAEKAPSIASSYLGNPASTSILTDALLSVLSVLAPKLAESVYERAAKHRNFGISYLYSVQNAATRVRGDA